MPTSAGHDRVLPMKTKAVHPILVTLVTGSAAILLGACGNPGPDAGPAAGAATAFGPGETYTAVSDTPLTISFAPNGKVVMSAEGLGSSSGTYTLDGEKIIVAIDNRQHTFIRDGNCIEEPHNIFGKLCKGGKAGEAANVPTRNVPTTPAGTYVATNEDGEFRIDFAPGNTLTLSITPVTGSPETQPGRFTIEGDTLYVTLAQGVPMVLKYVNSAYESTAFGLPMKFVRQ